MLKSTASMLHVRRLLVVAGLLLSPGSALGQTPELDRARATFAEALGDEQAGRTDAALEKFRSVAGVRDTAQVEYRIARCLEALGRRRPAVVAYDKAVHLGRGDPQARDVVAAANDRIAALTAAMGRLGVVVHGSDAPDVRVDGEAVARDDLGAIMLDPGPHVVDVSAPATKPARANVTIVAGGHLALTVDLAPERRAPPPAPPPPPPSQLRRDIGIGLAGVGAASGIGVAVLLLVRNDLIDSIHTLCPGDVCPVSSHDQVESMRSEASSIEAPAAVLGAFAAAAMAAGIVLVALGPVRRATALVVPTERGGAFVLRGTF
jgi:hypothetical protein